MSAQLPRVVLFGTLDTKADEYAYVRDRLLVSGVSVLLVDCGVLGRAAISADIDRATVAAQGGMELEDLVDAHDRGDAITVMASGAARIAVQLDQDGTLDAVLVLGGSNGGTLFASIASALPIGVPKILVSTMAAGDTRPYVAATDSTLMYPVLDVSGINRITAPVLDNAAGAAAGMATAHAARRSTAAAHTTRRTTVAASMFGVTTPCVEAMRDHLLRDDIDVLIFHGTGTGGRSMEALIRAGEFDVVADLTISELVDDLVGGACSAGPERLTAAAAMGIPQVVSFGAMDMINFGPPETVPAAFGDRLIYHHNSNITLVRTNPSESAQLGCRIASKLRDARGPVSVFIPTQGFSSLSVRGEVFYDPDADNALIEAFVRNAGPTIDVRQFDTDINDPEFALAVADRVRELVAGVGS